MKIGPEDRRLLDEFCEQFVRALKESHRDGRTIFVGVSGELRDAIPGHENGVRLYAPGDTTIRISHKIEDLLIR